LGKGKEENKTGENQMEKMESKIAKFTGTIELEQAMDRMVAAVNEGFSGGRVTKHDLVSWAVLYFEKNCFQECVEHIRQDHFDQVAYLESVLKDAKKARREGQAGPDLTTALAPLISQPRCAPSRRPKKAEATE
jgi:Fe-S cluster assembly ATPase SufC